MQTQIVQLCETWYIQQRDGAAQVAPQTLTWLIQSVLEKDKPASDVKRLLRFKTALKEMDIMHASSEALRRQLKQCIAHTYLLMNADGKKFLQFLFEIDPVFVGEVHSCIKGVLAYQKRAQVEAFAEIYYKAWKNSSGHLKVTIEEVCLQDFVTSALHLRNTTALKQVNIILKFFVDEKSSNRAVEGLLESLYGGVLWRSLHAPNPVVRENAVQQLALVFPLIRADQPQREIDDALSTSFQNLTDCLTDPHPNVRKGAILAAGRILTFYWELLPMHTTQVILELIFESLAFDKTAVTVREAVFRSTLAIAENPISHTTLKAFLPKLRPLLNDASERVRSQFALLLNTLKKMRTIKFYDVVPADQILRALGSEPSDRIRSQLASILENTFFPWSRKTVNELVERSLTMLLASDSTDADRRGAVAFFNSLDLSQVPTLIPVKFIGKLFVKTVLPWLEMVSQRSQSAGSEKPNKVKKQKVFDFEISVDDDQVIVGVLDIISTVWGAIQSGLASEENQPARDYIFDTFNDENLVALHAALPQCESIFSIAARIPAEKLPVFSAEVLKQAGDPSFASSASMLLQCVFSWDSTHRQKIISRLTDWLECPLAAPKPNKKDGGKPKQAAESSGSAVSNLRSALAILNSILSGGSEWIRDELLLSDQFDAVVDTLLRYKEIVISAISSKATPVLLNGLTHGDIVKALSAGYRVLIHRAGLDLRASPSKKAATSRNQINRVEVDDADKSAAMRARAGEELADALNWVETSLATESLPFFEDEDENMSAEDLDTPSEAQDLILRVSESVFTLVADFVALGLPLSSDMLESLVGCGEKLIRIKADDFQFTQAVCATCWKIALFHLAVVHSQPDASDQVSLISYDRLAVLLFQALRRDPSAGNRISTFGLRALLQQSQWSSLNPYKPIFMQRLWNGMLAPVTEDFDTATSRLAAADLPRDAALILSTIQGSAALLKDTCAFAKDCLQSSADSILDGWRVIEFVNLMTEEEAEGVTTQRKRTLACFGTTITPC